MRKLPTQRFTTVAYLSMNSTFLTYKNCTTPSTQRQNIHTSPRHHKKRNPSTSSFIFQPQSPPLVQRPYPTQKPHRVCFFKRIRLTQREALQEIQMSLLQGLCTGIPTWPGRFGMNPIGRCNCNAPWDREEPGGSFLREVLNENQQEILKPAFLMSIWITNLLRFKQQVFTFEKR